MNQASARACRLCKAALDGGAALELRRVPRGAQYFPKSDERASDYAVNLDIYQCPYCGLIQLSGEPVIYGEGETDSACPSVKAPNITTVAIGDGHHFGGDYQRLVEVILRGR